MPESNQESPASRSLQLALAAEKAGSPLAASLAREAFHKRLECALDQVVADMDNWFTEALANVPPLADSKGDVQERLLVTHASTMLKVLLPHKDLWYHYATDYPREKAALSRYASQTFVRDNLRCFVQASTTAIHLGRFVATNTARGTLFYTNSVAFPLTVLRGQGNFHQVWTFCGNIYDQACGGWLFPVGDTDTQEELRRLFRRNKDPLTTAFLMPMATKVVEGPLFLRTETALLARILMEEAQNIVILSPGNRILGEGDDLPPGTPLNQAWHQDWTHLRKRISLVVCGSRNGRESELLRAFSDKGLEVVWLDPPSPRESGEIGIGEDIVAKKELVDFSTDYFHRLFSAARKLLGGGGDKESVKEAKEFLVDVFELNALLQAFRSSRNRSLAGEGGVAALLGLSRNAVYLRLERFGLRAEDFRDEEINLQNLIEKCPQLKNTADRLLSQVEEPVDMTP